MLNDNKNLFEDHTNEDSNNIDVQLENKQSSTSLDSNTIPLVPTIDFDDVDSTNEAINLDDELDDNSQSSSNSTEEDYFPAYDFSSAICVKTSERILDDLRADPLFLLKSQEGMLSYPTVKYSSALSQIMKSNETKYNAAFWKTNDANLSSEAKLEIDHNTTLLKFTGILIPALLSDQISDFTKLKIFHYSISIKYKNDRIKCKNTFYGFKDDDLTENDRSFWIEAEDFLDSNEEQKDGNSSKSVKIGLKTLPEILDSANFISKETGTFIRLEIYPAIFTEKDLDLFTLTEIQTRIATFNSQVTESDSFDNFNLNPSNCFSKLENALKGPILQKDQEEGRNINLIKCKLEVSIDIPFMIEKFYFTKDEQFSQLCPIRLSKLDDLASLVCENYFRRALQETAYFKSITSMNKQALNDNFSFSFDDIFTTINEFDIERQIQNWNKWTPQYHSYSFILLSVAPYYQDDLIRHIYEIFTTFDPDNIPLYFDALTYCATSRYSEQLGYYVSLLQSSGVIGFEELKSIFKGLGFNVDNITCQLMNQVSDAQLLDAYKNQVIVSVSKEEKYQFRSKLEKIATFRTSVILNEFLNTEPFFDTFDAYRLLDIDPSLDDSMLITFYDYKVNESGQNFNPNVARAFYSISLERKSVILLNYIDTNLPQFQISNISLADSYKIIGVLETADDLQIIRIFQERAQHDPGTDFRRLWKSLKLIGEYRHSKLIEGYLSSGIVNSTFLAIDQSPAGLNNIGNTCYLNSLLQYYFVIEPLRDYILQFNEVFNPDEFENNDKYQTRRIGGRTVGLKETERSYQFMYQLRDLYSQLIHDNERCVTPSRELAYLAFSPISFEVEFEETVPPVEEKDDAIDNLIDDTASEFVDESQTSKNHDIKDESQAPDLIDLTQSEIQIKSQDDDLATPEDTDSSDLIVIDKDSSVTNTVSENHLSKQLKTAAVCKISPDQFECAFEIGSQQDVTECISNVLTQIESAMKPEILEENNEQIDMIKKLFFGKTKQLLSPVDKETKEEIEGGNVRTKIESFLNLIVNIGDHPKDIYDALDTFFTEDLLELEDGEVKRSLTIIELPKILQIQIQRVQFDRVKLIPVKSNDPIPFEEKLYMDRYLETDNEIIIRKRKELFHWRRRAAELNERKIKLLSTNEQGMSTKDVLKSTREYLTSSTVKELGIPVDMNTIEVLDMEIEKLQNELTDVVNELEILQQNISKQFKGFNKIGYSIFAIFIHRGQASYGHYFIYIRDPKSNVYRKYNDEIVSEVSFEEIFNFSDGNTSTPYYLTFIQDELIDKITPLKRDILVKKQLEALTSSVNIGKTTSEINDDINIMDLD